MNQTLEQWQDLEMIEWNLDCYYSQIIPDMRVEDQFDIVFNAPEVRI